MKTKEDLLVIVIRDGVEISRRVEKNRVIHKLKDGREWINYLTGRRFINRSYGQAVFHDTAVSLPKKDRKSRKSERLAMLRQQRAEKRLTKPLQYDGDGDHY